MLKNWGFLPSELAKQDPTLLFMAIDALSGEDAQEREIPPGLAFFYGE
ncbi:MAG: hypothetical protein SOS24_03660 [Clostridia bacterium]|nr:hypothetical protein [Clostridia bacterium]